MASISFGQIDKDHIIDAIFIPENLHGTIIPAIPMSHDFTRVAPSDFLKRFRHFSAALRRRHVDLSPRNLRW